MAIRRMKMVRLFPLAVRLSACFLLLGLGAACAIRPDPHPEAEPSAAPSLKPLSIPTQPASPGPLPGLGISWPHDQYLPSFAGFDALDVADMSTGASADEINLFATLEGLVNRTRPRIYLVYPAEEGPFTWLDSLKAVRLSRISDPWDLVSKYQTEIKGVLIYNPALPDTLNLATTMAGLQDGLAASPALAARLTAPPFNFKILADLRDQPFQNRLDVYEYAFTRFGAQTNQRLVISLAPSLAGNLSDYAVALRGLVIWLDPRIPAEEALLSKVLAAAPAGSPFVGYFPNPENGGEAVIIRYLSQHARPSFAMDYFQNATVFGGVPPAYPAPTPPPKAVLENKVYVTFFVSDGDNLQYIQHRLRVLWDDPRRGQVPVGWTFQPALADVAPGMLEYYRSSASVLDVLVSGPSGLGYTYPNDWTDRDALRVYARTSAEYMRRTGLRIITLWDANSEGLNPEVGSIFTGEMPGLLGVTHQNWSNLGLIDQKLPQIGLHPAYADSEYTLGRAISTAALAAGWADSPKPTAPVFVAAQVNAWKFTPSNLYDVMQTLKSQNPGMVFVRPDVFFMLARETSELPVDPSH